MKYIYLFDAGGFCVSSTLTADSENAKDFAKLCGAASFIVSSARVAVERARLVNGQLVEVEPLIDAKQQWGTVRMKRDVLLLQSDWTDLLSSFDRLGEVKYAEWQVYRQALRDVTSQPDPFKITWPTAPA